MTRQLPCLHWSHAMSHPGFGSNLVAALVHEKPTRLQCHYTSIPRKWLEIIELQRDIYAAEMPGK
jgi:hypothetical protein